MATTSSPGIITLMVQALTGGGGDIVINPGELLDGQYKYYSPNGESVLMGAATPYRVITSTGLRALAPISAADIKRTGQHGSLRSGPRTYNTRVLQLDIAIDAEFFDRDVELLLDDFYAACQVTDDEGILVMKRYQKDERLLVCTPRLAEFPGTYESVVQRADGSIQFAAEDPRLYGSALMTHDLSAGIAGGRTYDRTYDLTYPGGVASTDFVATNAGNVGAPPLVTFHGPVINPGVRLLETGQSVQVNISLGSSDSLEVDFDIHSILLNGTSRRALLDADSEWFELQPGVNTLKMLGDGAGGAIVSYQSAYVAG